MIHQLWSTGWNEKSLPSRQDHMIARLMCSVFKWLTLWERWIWGQCRQDHMIARLMSSVFKWLTLWERWIWGQCRQDHMIARLMSSVFKWLTLWERWIWGQCRQDHMIARLMSSVFKWLTLWVRWIWGQCRQASPTSVRGRAARAHGDRGDAASADRQRSCRPAETRTAGSHHPARWSGHPSTTQSSCQAVYLSL